MSKIAEYMRSVSEEKEKVTRLKGKIQNKRNVNQRIKCKGLSSKIKKKHKSELSQIEARFQRDLVLSRESCRITFEELEQRKYIIEKLNLKSLEESQKINATRQAINEEISLLRKQNEKEFKNIMIRDKNQNERKLNFN
jgi:hypothetical protein